MMYQTLIALACAQGYLQGLCHLLSLQAIVHMRTPDLARIRIRNKTHVNELVVRGQVGR